MLLRDVCRVFLGENETSFLRRLSLILLLEVVRLYSADVSFEIPGSSVVFFWVTLDIVSTFFRRSSLTPLLGVVRLRSAELFEMPGYSVVFFSVTLDIASRAFTLETGC